MHKLFKLHLTLKKLGNPTYLSETTILRIRCCTKNDEVEAKVEEMHNALTQWTEKVAELRNCYSWLLYYSIPKMMKLYQLIHSDKHPEHEKVAKIVQDVSFLVDNTPQQREKLKIGVKVCIK